MKQIDSEEILKLIEESCFDISEDEYDPCLVISVNLIRTKIFDMQSRESAPHSDGNDRQRYS